MAFLEATPNARGCNLTLPHKIDIMPLLDRIHPDAERIGAVNTVIKQSDGSLEGRNSDAFGFLAALQEGAPQWRATAGRSWCWARAARHARWSAAWSMPACRSCA